MFWSKQAFIARAVRNEEVAGLTPVTPHILRSKMGQHGTVRRPASVSRWEGGMQSDFQFVLGNLLILAFLAAGLIFIIWPDNLPESTALEARILGVVLVLVSQLLSFTVILSANKVVIDGDYIAWQPRFHRRPLRKYRWHQIRNVELYQVKGWIWGYGFRFNPRIGWGHIIKSGPAIRIIKNNGRSFVITVVDAQGAVETAKHFLAGKTK